MVLDLKRRELDGPWTTEETVAIQRQLRLSWEPTIDTGRVAKSCNLIPAHHWSIYGAIWEEDALIFFGGNCFTRDDYADAETLSPSGKLWHPSRPCQSVNGYLHVDINAHDLSTVIKPAAESVSKRSGRPPKTDHALLVAALDRIVESGERFAGWKALLRLLDDVLSEADRQTEPDRIIDRIKENLQRKHPDLLLRLSTCPISISTHQAL